MHAASLIQERLDFSDLGLAHPRLIQVEQAMVHYIGDNDHQHVSRGKKSGSGFVGAIALLFYPVGGVVDAFHLEYFRELLKYQVFVIPEGDGPVFMA